MKLTKDVGSYLYKGHIDFARVCEDYFDKPKKLRNWCILPDYSFIFKKPILNLACHRLSLHGLGNLNTCIRYGKRHKDFTYKKRHGEYIKLLITSHSFLDTFNGLVFDSYPKFPYGVHYCPGLFKEWIKWLFKDAPDLKPVYREILSQFDGVTHLRRELEMEYYRLPNREDWIVEKIKKGLKDT